MSDSFADLWSTTAPRPSKPKPQTLSAASSSSSTLGNTANASQGNRGYSATGAPKKDVFSMLAGSSMPTPRYGPGPTTTSAPHSRSLTPSHPSYTSTTSSNTNPTRPVAHQTFSNPVSKTNSSSTLAGDAFGDLFASASGTASSVSNTGNMTLAARLALESQQSTRSSSPGSATTMSGTNSTGSAWAGLDALGAGGGLLATPAVTSKPVGNVKVDDVDDWGLGDFGSATTTTTTTTTTTSSNSTANARKVPPANGSQKTTTTTTPKSLWDLDEFTSNSNSNSTGINRSHSDSPSTHPHPHKNAHKPKIASVDEPFDFGGREDRVDEERRHRHGGGKRRGLLDLSDDDEDEDGFGGGHDEGYMQHGEPEDDILGVLSGPPRPAQPNASSSSSNFTSSSRAPAQTKTNPNRPISPPPHILGQIVEMGFSVSQARKALAETSTGIDVEQALESLLSGGGGGGGNNIGATEEWNGNSRTQNAVEEPIPPRPRGAPKGQKERERERLERQRAAASSPSGSTNPTANPTVAEIQDQASELLSQASEIGLSVFSKASAMWGKGRERVVKAYEERGGVVGVVGHLGVGGGAIGRGRGEGGDEGGTWGTRGVGERGGQGRGARVDGRPRWMQEAIGSDEEDGKGGGGFADEHERGAFADDHDHDESNQRAETLRTPEEEPTALFDVRDEEVDLFAPASPAPRVTASASTSTQPPPQRTQRQPPAQRQPTQPRRPQPQQPQQTQQRPSSPPIPLRTLTSASASSLSTSLTHKTTGTASFKLGQYASSVSSYTSALECLPEGHLLRVPLYTNRAVARMKVGEYGGAEEDCKRALGIVRGLADEGVNPDGSITEEETITSLTWTPNSLPHNLRTPNPTSAWAHSQGLGVDLTDGYIKALKRRAECLEAREKWPAAMRDWEVLCGCGAWVGERVRAEAARARARCRGMIEGSSSTAGGTGAAPARPKPTARPKPKTSSTPQPPSKALAALQSTTAALEAEDALRHSLKDTVDARLLSWKSGKETNIRALLCSLDAVLWDGVLDGVRVKGLGDVVSPAQVKKAYVRVVGRVHPDKLNASNSNVEQRMLANGVFGTLNEAWIAFQAGLK